MRDRRTPTLQAVAPWVYGQELIKEMEAANNVPSRQSDVHSFIATTGFIWLIAEEEKKVSETKVSATQRIPRRARQQASEWIVGLAKSPKQIAQLGGKGEIACGQSKSNI